jgi:Ni,Fe-hydrogenase maturation factor
MKAKSSVFESNTGSEIHLINSFLVVVHSTVIHGNKLMNQITSQLKALDLTNVEVCMVEQLTPELASPIGTVDCVIFVDICEMRDSHIKVLSLNASGLETPGSSVPGLGHSWHPSSLLALTHSLYCHHPVSWWVKVAHQPLTGDNQISHDDQQIIHDVIQQVQTLINHEQSEATIKLDNGRE